MRIIYSAIAGVKGNMTIWWRHEKANFVYCEKKKKKSRKTINNLNSLEKLSINVNPQQTIQGEKKESTFSIKKQFLFILNLYLWETVTIAVLKKPTLKMGLILFHEKTSCFIPQAKLLNDSNIVMSAIEQHPNHCQVKSPHLQDSCTSRKKKK